MSRDPKINPEPGDVLCSARGYSAVVVDDVTSERVAFRQRDEGCKDALREVALDEWRRLAANPRTLTLADRIAAAEDDRAAAAERLSTLDRRLAWLRGVA